MLRVFEFATYKSIYVIVGAAILTTQDPAILVGSMILRYFRDEHSVHCEFDAPMHLTQSLWQALHIV